MSLRVFCFVFVFAKVLLTKFRVLALPRTTDPSASLKYHDNETEITGQPWEVLAYNIWTENSLPTPCALHRYRGGHGFESRSCLKFFFSGFDFTTA